MTQSITINSKKGMFPSMQMYAWMFVICSLIGWFCELICFRIADDIWVNRGFLHGPYLPIYGVGAVAITFFLKRYKKNPILVFLAAGIICCTLEYATGSIMEMLGGEQLWDYSDNPVNLNGRICLYAGLGFAAGGMVIVYIIEPMIRKIMENSIANKIINVIIICVLGLMVYSLLCKISSIFIIA